MDIHPDSLEALKVIQEAKNLDQATLLLRLAGYVLLNHEAGWVFAYAHNGRLALDLGACVEYLIDHDSRRWLDWHACSYSSIGAVISGEKT